MEPAGILVAGPVVCLYFQAAANRKPWILVARFYSRFGVARIENNPMSSPEINILIACCGPLSEAAARLKEALSVPVDWRRLIDRSDTQGTLPLLSRTFHRAGPLPIPPEFLAEIHGKADRMTLRSLIMAGELDRIMCSFDTAGLTPIAFKGPTLAYLAYGDFTLRDSADLDIFVPRQQLTAALNLLASDGYDKRSPGFKTSLAGGCEVTLRRNQACEVDLHWQFFPPFFIQFDEARALGRSVVVQTPGLAARTLCPEDLLIYLCIDAARDCWAIRSICDLTGLLRNQPLDWDDLLHEVRRARCWRAVAVGLRLAAEVLEAPIPPHVQREVERDPVVRALAGQFAKNLSSDIDDYAGAPGGAMLHLRMLDTVTSKANYLWRRALQPNHLDADFIRLPDSLAPAYYLIRPLRVACSALGRLRPQRIPPLANLVMKQASPIGTSTATRRP